MDAPSAATGTPELARDVECDECECRCRGGGVSRRVGHLRVRGVHRHPLVVVGAGDGAERRKGKERENSELGWRGTERDRQR